MRYLSLLFSLFIVGMMSKSVIAYQIDYDSLQVITVSGTAIVDTTTMVHPIYYIDTDGNNEPDYFLNFGPWWYEPDSSNATRPNNGDQITIEGGLWEENMMGYPMIFVYEINGEFWRDPFLPFWNQMGHHGANCQHNMDSCNNSGFGWQHDPPVTVSLFGYAIVDTSYMMDHYYLDEDNDGTPEYFLNFGPPWYEPTSGATRPENGDQIDIVGGMIDNGYFPMVIVYEINGLEWRDSTYFCGNIGGGWIYRYMTYSVQFNTSYDNMDQITMNPGWHTGGPGMGMMDSLFCQIFESNPDELFSIGNENAFAAYETDFYFVMGMGNMGQGMNCGENMQFGSNVDLQFHYTDAELSEKNIDESTIQVKYYDGNMSNWVVVSGASVDINNNTVHFSSNTVANFYILTGESPTSVETGNDLIVDNFELLQNYPNPFNPSTTISFNLPTNEFANLSVYNLIGEKVSTLVNSNIEAGMHSVTFDATRLPSGVYFYELKAGSFNSIKKMILLR